MTEEELEKEAEEWLCNNLHSASEEDFIKAMVDIAEPREKRIAELEKRCANYEMTISKMEKGTCDICKETEKDKKIEELEAEVKEWKDKADLWCKTANLKDHNIMINKELEKENAELKCECRRCVYSDSPCILSDYGKDRNGICDHFKDVFDEVVELKENNKELAKALAVHCQDTQEVIDEYEKENAELKKKNLDTQDAVTMQMYTNKANKEIADKQLTKAKEIIKHLLDWQYDEYKKSETDKELFKVIAEAEQFLKESEVEK